MLCEKELYRMLDILKGIGALSVLLLLGGVPFIAGDFIFKLLTYSELVTISTIMTITTIILALVLRAEKRERKIDVLLLRWCIEDGKIKIPCTREDLERIADNHTKNIDQTKVQEYFDKRNIIETRLHGLLQDYYYVDGWLH